MPDRPRDEIAGPDSGPAPPFPLKLDGRVVKGFGRGSSELGIPTANIPLDGLSVGGNKDLDSGIYFGWAGLSTSDATRAHPPGVKGTYDLMKSDIYDSMSHSISASGLKSSSDAGAVYPMVVSIGFNPFYNNTVRSVEVHIMHDFKTNFYDTHMNSIILGFIRGEADYTTKEALIEDIKTDIDVSGRSLARDAYLKFARDPYLSDFSGKSEIAS